MTTTLQNLGPIEQLRAGRLARRIPQLLVGLFLYGFSIAMQVRGALGVAPWDVLTQGLSRWLPLSFGTIAILVSVVVLLLWIPLRQLPGLGTICNVVLVGISADIGLALIPVVDDLGPRIALTVGGVVLNGLAGGLYIGAQFGPGPRDGLMTGLHRRTGRSLRLVRTGIEVVVLSIGWLLGGQVWIGTLLYALAIGPLTQFFLRWTLVRLPEPTI
ncbi:putative membrane protein YczE [Naumannella cuiyingiana]|uniref:Putative membrane protein YczE n=1 Tax=Naumannella cuiyingiana TaxID=1347891 RepID=A0A7Z0D6Z1_9ACTN|nr:putative membrane protein YczE [Naumannella cuiyingiana]